MRRRTVPTLPVFLVALAALAAALAAAGCGGGCDCCDLPHGQQDWSVEFTVGAIPDPVPEYPVDVDVVIEVRSLENGVPAPDGFQVGLSVAPGSFIDGRTEFNAALVGGGIAVTVLAPEAGVYEVTVVLPNEARTARTSFSVGL